MSPSPAGPVDPTPISRIDLLITLNRAHGVQELLRGLAHDLRNNLQVVALGATVGGGALTERVERAIDDMSEALQILGQLGRYPDDELAAAPLGATLALVERLAGFQRNAPAAPVRFAPPPDGLTLAIPQTALVQVLLNLILNAKEASEARGAGVTVAAERTAEGAVAITVSDLGPGLADAPARPLETSKSPRSHGGVGLFVATALAERYGGGLAIGPGERGGTRMTVTVPLATGA